MICASRVCVLHVQPECAYINVLIKSNMSIYAQRVQQAQTDTDIVFSTMTSHEVALHVTKLRHMLQKTSS